MPVVVLFIIFVALLVIAVPVSITLGITSVLPSVFDPSFTVGAKYLIRAMFGGLDSFPLLAVPMFVLSGIIMAKGGISKKLFDIFAYFLGRFTAGMPCAVIVTCLFYGAISGSAPATVAAVGSMTIPILTTLGYDLTFSTAIVAVAGGLGVIIPPSIPFIMYGMASGASVSDLFLAGIVPGLLLAFQKVYEISDEAIRQVLFNAGAVGYLAMRNATVAGAVGGCQAEVGIASAMAASAAVELMDGTPKQCLDAASTVLMNMLGLVCDPVGGLVEYPCQNRNAAGVANALIATEMTLAGVPQLIPFDEMLEALYKVGKRLPAELRETALGGCAATPSACEACHLCH